MSESFTIASRYTFAYLSALHLWNELESRDNKHITEKYLFIHARIFTLLTKQIRIPAARGKRGFPLRVFRIRKSTPKPSRASILVRAYKTTNREDIHRHEGSKSCELRVCFSQKASVSRNVRSSTLWTPLTPGPSITDSGSISLTLYPMQAFHFRIYGSSDAHSSEGARNLIFSIINLHICAWAFRYKAFVQ